EHLVELHLRADFVLGDGVGRHAKLAHEALRRLPRLLVLAGERLVRRFLFAFAEADDERVVAVLFLRSLADDREIALDDRAPNDGAVVGEVLGHAEFFADDAGMGVHETSSLLRFRWGRSSARTREDEASKRFRGRGV